ncbi:MAG: hypothetical protein E7218_02985 [Anaerofustis stercorihominis]|nr:hypothetical protein [Anaerofustis stercorihominis]
MQVEYISALQDAIKDIMLSDSSAILMGMNMSAGGNWGESYFLSDHISRKRIIDTPYSISSVLGAALGLAMSGAKPIVSVKGEYMLKAADTLANKIAINNYLTNGQYSSDMLIISELDISAQKGAEAVFAYESIFAQIRGLDVVCVSCAGDVKRVIKAAYENERPTLVFICTQKLKDSAEQNDDTYTIGNAKVIREGNDVTVITYGQAVSKVVDAAEEAYQKGVSAEVIDLMTLSDVDIKTIEKSVMKTGRVIVVQDAPKSFGICAEVISRIVESEAFFYLEENVLRICAKDAVVPYSGELFEAFVPGKDEILNGIIDLAE